MKRSEPRWPSRHVVEVIHRNQLNEHGGLPGARDGAALESALARARQRWAYDESSDVAALTAAYGYGLARNHSFNDGNKRIALMTMDLFAGLNGYAIDTSEEDVVVTMLVLAAGELTEPVLAGWLRGCLVRTVGRGG